MKLNWNLIICQIGIAGAVGFIIGFWQESYVLRMATKGIPVACMILVVQAIDTPYAKRIAGGFLFSLIGDLLLEANPRLFLVGLGAFLIAHLWYIAAFLKITSKFEFLRLIPFVIWGMSIFLILRNHLATMAFPIAVYTITICTMMWRASACLGTSKSGWIYRRYAVIGAVLFAVSDTLIAIDRFYCYLPYIRYSIIGLYWLGQYSIMLSALEKHPYTVDGNSMLVISCHADTGFDFHSLARTDEGMVKGHLDNFAGVYAVMNAYFSGGLHYDYVRIELTYGEEVDFAGAYQVRKNLRKNDMVLVVDVTGTPTDKDFTIEKCKNKVLRKFLRDCLQDMSFDLYKGCPDPIANSDEVDVYSKKCPYVCGLYIPCFGGDYNAEPVSCRDNSIHGLAKAICKIAKEFPKFSEAIAPKPLQ